MEKEISFLYKTKWKSLIFAGLFFSVCAVVLWHEASTNEQGLIIENIITLSVHSATIFYYVLAAISALFVLIALLSISSARNPKYLVFTETEIIIPPIGMQKNPIILPIKDIVSLNETNISGQVMLTIKTSNKNGVIQRSMLENKDVYEHVKKLINDLRALN